MDFLRPDSVIKYSLTFLVTCTHVKAVNIKILKETRRTNESNLTKLFKLGRNIHPENKNPNELIHHY